VRASPGALRPPPPPFPPRRSIPLKRFRNLRRATLRGHGPWIVVAAVLVALLVTPFALAAGEGRSLLGGRRNPSPNASLSYTRETQIIANTNTYGTRQSNKSTRGGGAIYGCRAIAGANSCVRASNLTNGRAFSFSSNGGTEVGRIDGPTAAAPFTTSATGVATGLNADRVDGQNADDIRTAAVTAAQSQFAAVAGDGTLNTTVRRGATAATRLAAGQYRVTFTGDIRTCIAQTTLASNDPALVGGGSGATVSAASTVDVTTVNAAGAAADIPFQITLTC